MTAWTVSSVRVRVPRIALLFILGCFSLACLPSLSSAQTVSPQTVEFDPSADHNATVGGVAVVEGYELRFYTVGGAQPVHVIELGKPTPEADGKIRFNFASSLGAWPVDGVVYEARVAAVGPGGSTVSAISNQFVFPGTTPPPAPCSYALSSTARSGAATASTGTLSVTAGTGCAWAAASDAGWLTVTSGASGSGNGSIGYSVAGNSTSSQRVGRLTIAGATFTFTQAGAACGYTFAPTTRTVGTAATTGSVGVTSATGCAWTAASSATWLSITSGGTGSGNGTINYSVTANSGSSVRSATLTVGTSTFTLTQSGSCTYGLSPTTLNVGTAATTGSVAATAGSGCAWTATSSATWLSITGGGTGTGNGTVNYSVAANSSTSTRSATITVGTATFSLTQDGACGYTLSPTTRTVTTAATTGSVGVTAGSACSWSASSSAAWLTVTSGGSGMGNGTVNYSVADNAASAARSATLTVGSATFTVTQNGSCVYTVTPTSQGFNPPTATASVTVTRGQRMLVDRHAIGILDLDHERRERDRERHCPLQRLGEHRFLLTDWHADGGRATRDHYAVRRHRAERSGRAAHRDGPLIDRSV